MIYKENKQFKIAVILPCYKSREFVLDVISLVGSEVDIIIAVDDCCPEKTGQYITENVQDTRVSVLFHEENQGVGGAMLTGYRAALAAHCDIMIKIDSDGQMDPRLIPLAARPIINGYADYVKGNRFFNLEDVKVMPKVRLIGNLGLSFLTKLSTGYWDIFDPTNGYTAIHRLALENLPFDKINKRYFFETDMLFRLNLSSAVVADFAMSAKYGQERSNLNVLKSLFEFFGKHICLFCKRIIYQYFLRDFNIASVSLIFSFILLLIGCGLGTFFWIRAAQENSVSTTGQVMLAVTPILLGTQFLFYFIVADQHKRNNIPLQILLDDPS